MKVNHPIYTDKSSSLAMKAIFVSVVLLFIVISFFLLTGNDPNIRLWGTVLFGIYSILIIVAVGNFIILKTSLYADKITPQYGLFKKEIPVEEITSVKLCTYKFTDFWGWGMRINLRKNVIAFNFIGDNYTGVLVSYKQKDYPKNVFISSTDPETLLAEIQKAYPSVTIEEKIALKDLA